jgi:hypothetical protein
VITVVLCLLFIAAVYVLPLRVEAWLGRRLAAREPARPPLPGPPHAGLSAARELSAVMHRCGCALTYLPGGDARVEFCPAHRRHRDWRAWEHELTAPGDPG